MDHTHVYYSHDYLAGSDDIETWRKSGFVAMSLSKHPIEGVTVREPAPATPADILLAHSPEYLRDVLEGGPLGDSQGFGWVPELPRAVMASTGGVLRAVDHVLSQDTPLVAGSLSSGLHHARRDHGAGFCTFNGVAIAALYAQRRTSKRILILDTDAHCGGGTHSIITRRARVAWNRSGFGDEVEYWKGIGRIDQSDLSVSPVDCHHDEGWPYIEAYSPKEWRTRHLNQHQVDPSRAVQTTTRWPRGQHAGLVEDADDYLTVLDRMLAGRDPEDYGLMIYNAGMDPHEDCAVGGLDGITTHTLRRRERIVFDWCRQHKIPCVFVLAGGYVSTRLPWNKLIDLHRLTIHAAAASNAALYGGV